MFTIDAKMFNVVESPYLFNNIIKEPDKFYLVNTKVKNNENDVFLLYMGEKLITPIVDVATPDMLGLVKSGGYIKVLGDGRVRVLKSDTAKKLAESVYIGQAEFDGSKSISLTEIGAVSMRHFYKTLEVANWTQSDNIDHPFIYGIDSSSEEITMNTYGDLRINPGATDEQIAACSNADISIYMITANAIYLSAQSKPPIDIPIEFVYFVE